MKIETLAQKLAPLRPNQVRRWRQARALAEPEMQRLMDQELVFLAQRLLGDPENRLLLSLPSESQAKGRFNLGAVLYEQPKWPFGLRTSELLQGLGVFGRAGAGKTNAVFHLLLQFSSQRVPFLFLDWKRTVRHLLPLMRGQPKFYTPARDLAPLAFNPFMPPPGLEPRLYAHQVVDVVGSAYTLGEGARSLLQKALVSAYQKGHLEPSAGELLDELHRLSLTGRARQWQVSAERALEGLRHAELTHVSAASQQSWVKDLLAGCTIIELDGLHVAARQFLVPTLCLWLYYVQLAAPKRERLQLVLIIEEAHHVLYRQEHRARESIMNMLLRQCREIGIGVIVVDQHPHLIASAALGNTFATLCLNQKDPADLNRAAALCLLGPEDKQWLSRLPVGQAIVKMQDRWREPFLVQVPPVVIAKGAVTDAVLHAYLDRKHAGSGTWRRMAAENGGFGRVPGGDEPLTRLSGLPSRSEIGLDESKSSPVSLALPQAPAAQARSSAASPGTCSTEPSHIDGGVTPRAEPITNSEPSTSAPLDDSAIAFLRDVITHPDDGVKARYRRLHWSMSRGTRIKDALVFAGWLEFEWLPLGSTRKILLRPTSAARKSLISLGFMKGSLPRHTSGHESLTHEYWKRFYARHFAQHGFEVTMEAARPSPAKGRVDVLARCGGKTIAVEIETGESDVAGNVKQDVLACFDRVLVVGASRRPSVPVLSKVPST